MRQKLLMLGASSRIFTIRPGTDCDLYLERNIVDAKYYGVASKESLKKQYSAKIWLVEEERTVKYREIIEEESRSIDVLPGPKLSGQKSFFKGKALFKKEVGFAVGFKKPADPSSFGKVYQYNFDVKQVREPLKQLVESNGWKFEQIVMDHKPSRGEEGEQGFCTECGSKIGAGDTFCSNCGQKRS